MQKTNWGVLALTIIMLMSLTACSKKATPDNTTPENTTVNSGKQIYLYGEAHAEEAVMEKELELWNDYYHNDGMRHMFIEISYCGGEFLNIWMKSDNDDVLDDLYNDWTGTLAQTPAVKNYYKQIKRDCPETIFHGIDVGHQWNTTEKRFLEHLEQNGLENTEQYTLAQKSAEQGKHYRETRDDVYRENAMTENFIREFDPLVEERIMGIFGGAHADLDGLEYTTHTVPCMANQLKEHYGDIIYSEDISWIRPKIKPSRVDTIEINGKSYEASYFVQQTWQGNNDYTNLQYWRLENAYDDFKDNSKTEEWIPYGSYPMSIETGQVFVLDCTKPDGSVIRKYHRSDGNKMEGVPITEGFTVE